MPKNSPDWKAVAPASPEMAWTAGDIVQFIDTYGGKITQKSGQTHIDFPENPDRDKLLAAVLPHLKARKAEVIEYLYPLENRTPYIPPPDPFAEDETGKQFVQLEQLTKSLREPLRERSSQLGKLRKRGTEEGKRVYLLLRSGRIVVDRHNKPRKAKPGADPLKPKPILPEVEATHGCIEGDGSHGVDWVKLTKVTTAAEDERIRRKSPVPKKVKNRKWEGG